MNRLAPSLAVEPHMLVMSVLFAASLVIGYAVMPGDSERIAMLERDGKNRQALSILEERFAGDDRRPRTLYQLAGLYEQFGDLARLRTTLEALAEARPRDAQVQRRLALFYKATQNDEAYIAALEREIALRYSEQSCKELVGLLRLKGDFDREEAAIDRCRQRGYRRADDLVRLAELLAADGDAAQASQLLRSVDDLKRLKSEREKLQLFTMLVEADQPREARRRAVRWVKAGRETDFTLTLIETLVRLDQHDVAIELARDVSTQGDPVSLTVAEVMLDRGETVAAGAFLRGWAQSARPQGLDVDTAMRFVDAALDAEDADAAFAFAEAFGLARLPQVSLVGIAEALGVLGRRREFERVRVSLSAETLAANPLLRAAEELQAGQQDASRQLLDRIEPDKLDVWKLTLWARLMRETGRASQAQSTLRTLGVEPLARASADGPAPTGPVAAAPPTAAAPTVSRAPAVAARPAAEPAQKVLRRKRQPRRFQVRNFARQKAAQAQKAEQKASPAAAAPWSWLPKQSK